MQKLLGVVVLVGIMFCSTNGYATDKYYDIIPGQQVNTTLSDAGDVVIRIHHQIGLVCYTVKPDWASYWYHVAKGESISATGEVRDWSTWRLLATFVNFPWTNRTTCIRRYSNGIMQMRIRLACVTINNEIECVEGEQFMSLTVTTSK